MQRYSNSHSHPQVSTRDASGAAGPRRGAAICAPIVFVLGSLSLAACVIGGDGTAANQAPVIESVEADEYGSRCVTQTVCATARDAELDAIEFEWRHTNDAERSLVGPRVVSTTDHFDGSVTQCVEFIPKHDGVYELEVSAYNLTLDDDGMGSVRDESSGYDLQMVAVAISSEQSAAVPGVCPAATTECTSPECARVSASGSVYLIDNSVFGASEGTFDIGGACVVDSDTWFSSFVTGGDATCVWGIMADVIVECTLEADDSVSVRVIGKVFEDFSCPNTDLDGVDEVTLVVPPGESRFIDLHVDAGDGDSADISLTIAR